MKSAIITGGSKGIGRASAIALARQGHAVVINYVNSADDAEDTVGEIAAFGGTAIKVAADVASSTQVSDLFSEAKTEFGGVDIVVASAGVMAPSAIADTTDEEFDRQFKTNVRGSFNVFREAARQVRDGGRIIGFSSTTLALNAPGYSIYNATKGAVEGMIRVIAKELGSRGITVNAIAPGPVETELFLRGKSNDDIERMATMAPLKRIGRPDDIAHLVAFLASPEAAWINGQVLRANGGIA
ncbi:SDR family oxidoreductase [Brucella intermedia]|uniref:SDR family oxidoreductase n=1 Tax=Brucella intermedia TaxID=94625 RepID=UPI001590FCF5|nr:SDR family oxidoreductase [Brucella intermedia]